MITSTFGLILYLFVAFAAIFSVSKLIALDDKYKRLAADYKQVRAENEIFKQHIIGTRNNREIETFGKKEK